MSNDNNFSNLVCSENGTKRNDMSSTTATLLLLNVMGYVIRLFGNAASKSKWLAQHLVVRFTHKHTHSGDKNAWSHCDTVCGLSLSLSIFNHFPSILLEIYQNFESNSYQKSDTIWVR